jgi:hypothetical protein
MGNPSFDLMAAADQSLVRGAGDAKETSCSWHGEGPAPMMGMFFANPWGLLALAAVPAIVAIHFLQERSRRVRASTLFLLERAAPLPAGGIRLEKFRNSLPFWMQLLAATALTWLLADPRWIAKDSRQTVAVVLDSSASMQAARPETLDLLARRLGSWDAVAARTDWHLLETGPGRPPLYAGRKLSEVLAAARGWRPTLGTHDVAESLAIASTLVPPGAGTVILVTDRPTDVPGGVGLLSAGAAFDNVGFSGGDVELKSDGAAWRVLVTNHGAEPQERALTARSTAAGGEPVPLGSPQVLSLAPGQSRTLQGAWPAGAERLVLALAGDRFGFDDTLPLVRPVPRTVKVAVTLGGPTGDLLGRMVRAAEGVEIVADPAAADLVLGRFDPAATTDAIQVAAGELPAAEPAAAAGGEETAAEPAAENQTPRRPAAFDPAWVAAEDTALTRDLGWGGLLSGPAGNLGLTAADEPLVWKGGRPLAFVRTAGLPGGRTVQWLVLNFDVAGSTAARVPAVVVLVQRFLDRIRVRIPRPWADNFETGQALDLPDAVLDAPAGRATLAVEPVAGEAAGPVPFRGRAPREPAFFTVAAATAAGADAAAGAAGPPARLVTGAAQFADSREGDFRTAAPLDTLESVRMERAIKQSVADPWAPLWLGIAIAALLVAWGWKGRGRRSIGVGNPSDR